MSFNLGKIHSSSTSSAWKVPSQLVSESSFVLNFLFKSTGSELSLNSDRFKICSFELLYGQRLILMPILRILYTSRNSLSQSGIKDMMLEILSHTVGYEARYHQVIDMIANQSRSRKMDRCMMIRVRGQYAQTRGETHISRSNVTISLCHSIRNN